MKDWKLYVKTILVPVVLGGIVGWFISSSIMYDNLIQPPLAPPSFLFPIVWTILYILMGVSYGLLVQNGQDSENISSIYYLQLFVNLLWPLFFFVLQWRLFAFFWLLLLIGLVIVMIIRFYRNHKGAGLLQIPYLLWLFFAAYLNLSIYILNEQ